MNNRITLEDIITITITLAEKAAEELVEDVEWNFAEEDPRSIIITVRYPDVVIQEFLLADIEEGLDITDLAGICAYYIRSLDLDARALCMNVEQELCEKLPHLQLNQLWNADYYTPEIIVSILTDIAENLNGE